MGAPQGAGRVALLGIVPTPLRATSRMVSFRRDADMTGAGDDDSSSPAVRFGVILPPDNAMDPELPSWCPQGVTTHVTRLSEWSAAFENDMGGARFAAQPRLVARAAASLSIINVDVMAFACTSASFVGGIDGERALVDIMRGAGATSAITTSGAMLEAFESVGARRVCVATPYDDECTAALVSFIEEAGFVVTRAVTAVLMDEGGRVLSLAG